MGMYFIYLTSPTITLDYLPLDTTITLYAKGNYENLISWWAEDSTGTILNTYMGEILTPIINAYDTIPVNLDY